METVSDLRGVRVLLRASLNVPVADGVVQNRYRLEHALPTLRALQAAGARTIVVAHIGREPNETLHPVYEALGEAIELTWGGPVTDPDFAAHTEQLPEGGILLAENLRQDPREHDNDPDFAALLASYADIYINDAFANMHREHASIVGVPEHLPAYAGLRVMAEVDALSAAMQPEGPSYFMLGGAKFATKLQLVAQALDVYDEVFIGGALAHDVMRARGYEIGQSLVSDLAPEDLPFAADARVVVPHDVVVRQADGTAAILPSEAVQPTDTILDCGPETAAYLAAKVSAARTVLWNGPLGNYEAGFNDGTETVAAALADSSATSYVGGGDTVAAIESLGRLADFTFISTGGGAMLAFLEHGTLPGLEYVRAD